MHVVLGLPHTFSTFLLSLSEWMSCIFEGALFSCMHLLSCFECRQISAAMRPSGSSHVDLWIMCLVTLSEGRWGNYICVNGSGVCLCPLCSLLQMPLVWCNHGSYVDLNNKCAWHQILDKESASVVAMQSGTYSTYWRLNSFRFIRLIEPTHSKSSTLKSINL